MILVETPVFTRQINGLLSLESYRALQLALVDDPVRGATVRGSGGLRKMRWQGSGRGRRGGIRVIYFWIRDRDMILLLLAYPKKEQDDLTPKQLKVLRQVVEEELR